MQLIQPSEALKGHFDSPALEANSEQPKKLGSIERRHGFWVGNIGLLLPYDMTCEVSAGLPVFHLPNSPIWLTGMCNLRGNMAPMFDMSLLFDINVEQNTKRSQLFIQIDDEWLGVYSDRLPARVLLDKNNKLNGVPPIPDELHSFVHSCYQQTDVWLDWDITGFFSWLAEQVPG